MYGMEHEGSPHVVATFAEVYPNVIVYATIEDADLVLIGSDAPLVPSLENAQKLFRLAEGRASELSAVPIDHPDGHRGVVPDGFLGTMLELAAEMPQNTDDNMAIEYSVPLNLHLARCWGRTSSCCSTTRRSR